MPVAKTTSPETPFGAPKDMPSSSVPSFKINLLLFIYLTANYRMCHSSRKCHALKRRPAHFGLQVFFSNLCRSVRTDYRQRPDIIFFNFPKFFFVKIIYKISRIVGTDSRDFLRREILLCHEPRDKRAVSVQVGQTGGAVFLLLQSVRSVVSGQEINVARFQAREKRHSVFFFP